MPELPSRRESIGILRKAGCSSKIIKHCEAVSSLAVKIALRFRYRGIPIDLKVVEIGGLLHDIGRSKTHDVGHGAIGADLARSFDLPDTVVNIIERHIGAGIRKEEARKIGLPGRDFVPLTLEEKIVAYADKLVKGDHYISFDEALKDFSKELGPDHPAIKRFRKLHEEISKVVGESI